MTKKEKEKKVAETVLEFFKMDQEYKEAEKANKELRKEFYSFMEENSSVLVDNKFSVEADTGEENSFTVTATRVQNVKVLWDPDALLKTKAKEAVYKVGMVADVDGFIKYLKGLGASPQKVKQFLTVEKKVDSDRIKKMDELGLIDKSEISDCCTTEISDPYYKVQRTKRK
jgi:hypothetical protein